MAFANLLVEDELMLGEVVELYRSVGFRGM